MTEKEIARINELARLKKERPLTQAEASEQQKLRRQYIDEPMNHRLFCFRPLHSMVLIVLK